MKQIPSYSETGWAICLKSGEVDITYNDVLESEYVHLFPTRDAARYALRTCGWKDCTVRKIRMEVCLVGRKKAP